MTSILKSKRAALAGTMSGPIPREGGSPWQNIVGPIANSVGKIIGFFTHGIGLMMLIAFWIVIIITFFGLVPTAKAAMPKVGLAASNLLKEASDASTGFVKYVAYYTSGEFANPTPTEDTTLYGIYLPTDSLTPQQYKFRQDDKIVIKATPKVRLFGTEDNTKCVSVSCALEDSDAKAEISPQECISPRDLARTPVTCTFPPLVGKREGKTSEKVSMTLTYDMMKASATLPFTVISKEKFNAEVDDVVSQGGDYNDALDKIAAEAGVSKQSTADSKKGPLSIGASIVGQPAPVGDTIAMVVTLQNTGAGGDGTVRDIQELSISLPEGTSLIKCTDVDVAYTSPAQSLTSLGNYVNYVFKGVDVPSMNAEIRKGDFRTYDCFIDASGATLNKAGLFFGRINIEVGYTYNTTTETFVRVASCDELVPPTCGAAATADSGTTTGDTSNAASTAPDTSASSTT